LASETTYMPGREDNHEDNLAVPDIKKVAIVTGASQGLGEGIVKAFRGRMNSATKSLAIEYATRGIRVNTVAPGVIRTPMHKREIVEQPAAFHLMNKVGEVEDIVRAVLYLEDAAFSTGEVLHVDGGLIADR
jgi:NAD(P)-dependent dehydrogenase (short-subunit alcohol dehydrogenase family)